MNTVVRSSTRTPQPAGRWERWAAGFIAGSMPAARSPGPTFRFGGLKLRQPLGVLERHPPLVARRP